MGSLLMVTNDSLTDMATCLKDLTTLADRFDQNEEIHQQLARALANAVIYYGKNNKLTDMATCLQELTTLAGTFWGE